LTLIAYLAHDLTDPAIHRRVAMLTAGGAQVTVAGLSRGPSSDPDALDEAMSLGQSADGRLAQRALKIASIVAGRGTKARLIAHFGQADVLVARNLEMLSVAVSLLPSFAKRPRLVYECLDLHRLLTAPSPAGSALRALERRLARHVDLVLTSSPAFVTHHLGRVFGDRIAIVENRVLDLDSPKGALPAAATPPGPPWRIGWFGVLRCQRSLEILSGAARIADGAIEVVIRGRPSQAIFPDFAALVRQHPHLRFEGPYDPADLAEHYGEVHFAWGVDLYEEGANSDWLLPNRLYESVHFGTVPIARRNCETGRFQMRHGIGITLDDLSPEALAPQISGLTADSYGELVARQRRLPPGMWRADRPACADLVATLVGADDVAVQRQRAR
jgi:succinoglycan biosynthesis protein ExoL